MASRSGWGSEQHKQLPCDMISASPDDSVTYWHKEANLAKSYSWRIKPSQSHKPQRVRFATCWAFPKYRQLLPETSGWIMRTILKARRIAEEVERQELPWHLGEHLARIYAIAGDYDRAFKWLEKAYKEHACSLVFLAHEPCYESLRGDPRFADLLHRMVCRSPLSPNQNLSMVSLSTT
jgi:hypothetical protein